MSKAGKSSIVPFGEIARHVSRRVEPSTTDAEVYVGLEHLDPDSLRIKRWGSPAEVKGQKLEVKQGQIIFGKRRAYQRKLGVAHFDGICSAHAMVLEANEDRIIPELLPFFMQSDMFMDRAIAISEGSLSPTIKWKTLANQKFPLPSMGRQQEVLEVLQALEDSLRATEDAIESAEQLKCSLRAKLLTEGIGRAEYIATDIGLIPDSWSAEKLSSVGKWLSGGTPSKRNPAYWNGEIPWVSTKDLKRKWIAETKDTITQAGATNGTRVLPKYGLLIPVRGMGLANSFAVALAARDVAFNQDIKGVIVNESFDSGFVYQWLKHRESYYMKLAGESTHGTKILSTDDLFSSTVPKPGIDEQRRIAGIIEKCEAEIQSLLRRRSSAIDLKMKVGNWLLN